MKKLYFISIIATTILYSCGGEEVVESEIIGDAETFSTGAGLEAASEKFSQGEAKSPQDFFGGMLSDIVEADVKLKEVLKLDEMDASEKKIETVLDEARQSADRGRKSLTLYEDKTWPLRAEFTTLSYEWYDKHEACIDMLYKLKEPMSRPDDTWTEDELETYEEYAILEDQFREVDMRWIDFQSVFAEANDMELQGNVDEEALIEEQLEEGF